ncbi:hypothetical protein R3P38DRAFT_3192999 [Favolaschia claudopus]|uniref:Uncharacterized protein n=1 Tax=Favolaschia claudopus TaxID=2862362 RepID=A0AAW0BK72_9AGAR
MDTVYAYRNVAGISTGVVHPPKSLLPPMDLVKMGDFLGLDFYFLGLSWTVPSKMYQVRTLGPHSSVRPSSVVKHVAGDMQEMAFIPEVYLDLETLRSTWSVTVGDSGAVNAHNMPNGWTRVFLSGIEFSARGASFELSLIADDEFDENQIAWFLQANYIFRRLDLSYSSCSYIDSALVRYRVAGSAPGCLRDMYLFLPPRRTFLSLDCTRFCFPKEEPYWSFDSSGNDRLAPSAASNLCLPQIELEFLVKHIFMDKDVLDDIRTFDTRKGFNANSQDIAPYLRQPLYYFGDEGDPTPSPLIHHEDLDDSDLFNWDGEYYTSREVEDNESSEDDFAHPTPFLEDAESDDEQILYPRIGRAFAGEEEETDVL